MNEPQISAAPVVDPTIDAMSATPEGAAGQDMTMIQVPHDILATLASVLPGFTQMVVAAAEKSQSDIAAQKAGEPAAGAPGTMAPDDMNSPENLADELSKMRR